MTPTDRIFSSELQSVAFWGAVYESAIHCMVSLRRFYRRRINEWSNSRGSEDCSLIICCVGLSRRADGGPNFFCSSGA